MSQCREHKKRKLLKLQENPKLFVDFLKEKFEFYPTEYQEKIITCLINKTLESVAPEIIFKQTLNNVIKGDVCYDYSSRKILNYINWGTNRTS